MVKKNYKIIIGIVIGIIVSSIGVYAASLPSSEVTYDNKVSGMQSSDLQGAIDELYDKTKAYKNVNYITSVSDLEKLRTEVNDGDTKKGQYYALISDLDMGGKFSESGEMLDGSTNWEPIGTSDHPFSGTFDGMGHVIKKLYSKKDSEGYVGLFGRVYNGTIKNLGIEDSYSISNSSSASMLVTLLQSSTIDNCYNKGNAKGVKGTAGIVGTSGDSTITNCYNTGTIDSSDNQFAGGIIGYQSSGRIENCYNIGTIIGGYEIGGIGGGIADRVINTYNLGNITGKQETGGIAGQLHSNGLIKNSYSSGSSICGIVADITASNSTQKLENNHYLKRKATYGVCISYNDNYPQNSDSSEASPLEQMPDILTIINGDGAFIADTNMKNNGNPILKWES